MPMLARPGVNITQSSTPASPTVLTPTLVPCIVGPCFQIVDPLKDGILNPEARVSTAAVLEADAPLVGTANLSGSVLELTIMGVLESVQFPVVGNGGGFSKALITNILNAQLSGAYAEYGDDNVLRFSTYVKGQNASIAIDTTSVTNSAAADLDLTTSVTMHGKASYDNLSYTVPYASLPSPKTAIGNVQVKGSALSAYRYLNNRLWELSAKRAINWTSYIPKDATTPDMHNASSQWLNVPLWAIKTSGAKTNTVANLGTQAAVTVPLQHKIGSGSTVWPDVTGRNYLRVSALRVNPLTGAAGLYVGAAGNGDGAGGAGVDVVFAADQGGQGVQVKIEWAAPVLTITNLDATTTFAQFKAALDIAKETAPIKGALEITLAYDANVAGDVAMAGLSGSLYSAWGGTDPDSFSADASATAKYAFLTGSTYCGDTSTAATMGVAGEHLYISIDGGDWVDVELASGVAVKDSINTKTTAVLGGNIADAVEVKQPDGVTAKVLQLSTALVGTHVGADSTIEVRASRGTVLPSLFGGFISMSEAIPGGVLHDANAWGVSGPAHDERRAIFTAVTDYNKLAVSPLEKAIQPGSITLDLTNLVVKGFIACTPSAGGIAVGAKALNVIWTHGATVKTAKLDLGNGALATDLEVAEKIAARLLVDTAVADDLSALVQVAYLNGQIIFSEMTGTAGAYITLEAAGGNTTANVANYLRGDQAVSVMGVPATTILTGSATLRDSTLGVWQVVSVGPATLTSSVSNPAVPANPSVLTALLLDADTGFCYSTGSSQAAAQTGGAITFTSQLSAGVPIAENVRWPLIFATQASTTGVITYSRCAASMLRASPVSYEGRIFQGRPNKVVVGDTLYDNGVVKGKVMAIQSIGGFTGNALVLSDFTVSNGTTLTQWYCVAENLTSASTRILPELIVSDTAKTMTAKHALNRNKAGIPEPSRVPAPMYVGYKALRTDVSPAAVSPALMAFANIEEVDALIGPVVPENPLAFSLRSAFLNTTDIIVAAMGVGDTAADAPDGTVDAYKQAFNFLERQEVYAIAPLTQQQDVHALLGIHCDVMSAAAGRKERVGFVNPALPTEKVPLSVRTDLLKIGDAYGANGTKYDLTAQTEGMDFSSALEGKKTASGALLTGMTTFTAEDGVYLKRAGDHYRYLVVAVSADGTVLTIDTDDIYGPGGGPGTGGNADAYYRTTAPVDFAADGEECGVWIRQPAIDLSTTAGKLAACEAMAELTGGVGGYKNRRLYFQQPEMVGIEYNGSEAIVPGYHACVIDAARSGQLSPSQPFTNMPYPTIKRVIGSSDKFSENQMATAAAGGVWWLIQDDPGGPVVCRHQLSTDTTSLKSREYSIVRSVDYLAKVIRVQTRRFIGRNNITKELLDMLGMSLNSALDSVIGTVVQGASVDSIQQDASNPDQVVVEVSARVFYPCNAIRISIVA